ncbi:histidine kinase [Pendulispora brunnea]|uniref:Histidine kinase n=1 Tax=Pendulispora brunnea TaxID=2905690 RepID=A0ABZ2K9J1_9BACT
MAKPKFIFLGLLAALAVLYVRDVVRAAFGVPDALPTLADFVISGIWLCAQMVLLTIAFHRSRQRGYGPKKAALVSLLVAAATSAPGYGAFLVLRHAFPTWGLLPPEPGEPETATFLFVLGLADSFFILSTWTLVIFYPTALLEARERASEADRLRREMELYRIRTTLEPHFVLNTLNAIGGLMTEEPETARQLVGDLGALLRDLVRESQERERPLGDELEWLERYTAILETRHAGRLAFEWDVAPALRAHKVPTLVLQPLVENAVQHGALCRASDGRIRLSAHLDNDQLVVVVEDNGPGLAEDAPREGARGLDMVRRRLALESPDAILRLESSDRGTRATLSLNAVQAQTA